MNGILKVSTFPRAPPEGGYSPTSTTYSPCLAESHGPLACLAAIQHPLAWMCSNGHELFVEVMFPKYIDFRTLLRLASACKELRDALLPSLKEWVARNCGNLGWKAVKVEAVVNPPPPGCWYPEPESGWRRKWMTHSALVANTTCMRVVSGGKFYTPVVPSPQKAWEQMTSKLCRECYQPTTSICSGKGNKDVLVCGSCQKDEDGYSSLVNHKTAVHIASYGKASLPRRERAAIECMLAGARKARHGRYWRHEIVKERRNLVGGFWLRWD